MDRRDQAKEVMQYVPVGDATDVVANLQLAALGKIVGGELLAARQLLQRATQLQPEVPEVWVNLGNVCLEMQDVAASAAAFQRARALGDRSVACLLGYGLALLQACRFADAGKVLRQAYALEPGAADVCLAYAQCLCELECFDQARECVSDLRTEQLLPAQQQLLAWLLAQTGADAQAVHLYQQLLGSATVPVIVRIQYVLLLERLNRLTEAERILAGVCSDGADAIEAMYALASARVWRRRADVVPAISLLRSVLGSDPALAGNRAMRAQLWFELAKCLDLQNDSTAVMEALAQAHAAAAAAFAERSPGVDLPSVLGWLQQRRWRPAAAPARRVRQAGKAQDPVFLVGFPRSGTTLLERVLDGHEALDVLDERPALEAMIARLRQTLHWSDDDLDGSLDRLTAAQCSTARQHYWQQVQRYLRPKGRLVDKYPLTLTRLPYVAHLFARADWLLLLRHPCDCVLSCHMQAFGVNGGALAFASLEATARSYAAVMTMWEQQRLLQPVRVHVVRYEELVQDFSAQVAQAMNFLGLSLQPQQLDVANAVLTGQRRINTPSYAQVIRPVNAEAVGRWQRYRAHFNRQTLDLLAPWIQRYGYTLD